MTGASSAAYYDFQGLSALRTQAVQAPKEAVREVAEQFESLFMQMMLKSMRDATIEGGLFDSHQMEVYQGMLDQQLSLHLSSRSALGLADILVEQLDGGNATTVDTGEAAEIAPLANLMSDVRRNIRTGNNIELSSASTGEVQSAAPAAGASEASTKAPLNWNPSSPEEFIRGVWDHAVAAAGKLGLDPLVLVAQSALESGWGKRVIRSHDGSSSFNVFGIKSGGGWQGKQAAANTLEFSDGLASMQRASFRVYDSLANSFEDYVDFLQANPRYQQALEKVADSREFLRGLQDAGYATDPGYAAKIMKIMGTSVVGATINELKKI